MSSLACEKPRVFDARHFGPHVDVRARNSRAEICAGVAVIERIRKRLIVLMRRQSRGAD